MVSVVCEGLQREGTNFLCRRKKRRIFNFEVKRLKYRKS